MLYASSFSSLLNSFIRLVVKNINAIPQIRYIVGRIKASHLANTIKYSIMLKTVKSIFIILKSLFNSFSFISYIL